MNRKEEYANLLRNRDILIKNINEALSDYRLCKYNNYDTTVYSYKMADLNAQITDHNKYIKAAFPSKKNLRVAIVLLGF